MVKSYMNKNYKIIEQLLLAAIIGVVSIGVSFVGDMSKNMQTMSVSVQELNVKMGTVTQVMTDHESRLRMIEHKRH